MRGHSFATSKIDDFESACAARSEMQLMYARTSAFRTATLGFSSLAIDSATAIRSCGDAVNQAATKSEVLRANETLAMQVAKATESSPVTRMGICQMTIA